MRMFTSKIKNAALVLVALAQIISFSQTVAATNSTTRADFLKVIDRPRVPLKAEEKALPQQDGLSLSHFTFAADAEQRVPGLLVKSINSNKQRRPVVIALHGTGGNKESQLPLLKELAERGFVAVAIDGRYHGERSKAGSGAVDYNAAILRAYRTGREHPFLYDTVWDVMRLVDYLETRPDVDAKRIGVIGFSKGGMEAYLAAAVDPRISVAIPCIAVQSYAWALEHDSWMSRVETFQVAINTAAKDAAVAKIDADFVRKFYDRVVPGIYTRFDGQAMLPLIAPRPLLIINGDSDPRTPLAGVMEIAVATRAAYSDVQATVRFTLLIQENTGHQVTPHSLQAAIAWLMKWLKP